MKAMTFDFNAFHQQVLSIVGPSGVVDQADSDPFLVDFRRRYKGQGLVVKPASTAEVARVVALCDQHQVPVVPQGGNTGLCGGSVPPSESEGPTVVLVLSRMNQIVEVNAERGTATVQAGVTIQALQEASAAKGLLFAPDWGARGTAQIGGGLSTNAGGINVLRWGTMREQVLGLEVVMADGRVWDGLRSLRKDATGIDLKQLFIGAEGTLGVITGAVVRLHPLPGDHVSALVTISSLDGLMALLEVAKAQAGSALSAFELIPDDGVEWVCQATERARRPLPGGSPWYVLMRLSGGEEVFEQLADLLAIASEADLITDAAIASSSEQEENLWFIRDELANVRPDGPGIKAQKFDMAVPVDQVVPFLQSSTQLLEKMVPGTRVYAFGHIGDGNLHFSFYPGPATDLDAFAGTANEMAAAIDDLTWQHDGTVSAEHGVGQEMRSRVANQKPPLELELAHRIKAVLDPNSTMNPHKVYPVS